MDLGDHDGSTHRDRRRHRPRAVSDASVERALSVVDLDGDGADAEAVRGGEGMAGGVVEGRNRSSGCGIF